MKTAVLLTCFNRKEKTQKCLRTLFTQALPQGMELEVFVCDDDSSDGTSEMIREEFPQVQVVFGTGSLFWGGGMREAWKAAKAKSNFDFYLWLNDDTYLINNALINLFGDYFSLGKPAILVGTCMDSKSQKVSFGGAIRGEKLEPNGTLQRVEMINGNLVLIPSEIENKINGILPKFTHYFGDYDYGLRAQKHGFNCLISTSYLAICDFNPGILWGTSKTSLTKRWRLVHDTKGLAISEYFYFLKIHKGYKKAVKTAAYIYLRALMPDVYNRLKKYPLTNPI